MGKSPKLFYYGHRPKLQFGVFGGPTLISEVQLPKPKNNSSQGSSPPSGDLDFLIGKQRDIVFRNRVFLSKCQILAESNNPLPQFGRFPHHWFYQEGRHLVFLYKGKRIWALRNELVIV